MPTVKVTFVQATFALVTFVHIRIISAVVDPILTKLYRLVPGIIFNRCQALQRHLSRHHMSWQHLSISAICQGKDKSRSRQGQVRSEQGKSKVKES